MTDIKKDEDVNTPHARPIPRDDAKSDHLKDKGRDAENRQEALIDESVEETFPASDPASPKHIT